MTLGANRSCFTPHWLHFKARPGNSGTSNGNLNEHPLNVSELQNIVSDVSRERLGEKEGGIQTEIHNYRMMTMSDGERWEPSPYSCYFFPPAAPAPAAFSCSFFYTMSLVRITSRSNCLITSCFSLRTAASLKEMTAIVHSTSNYHPD